MHWLISQVRFSCACRCAFREGKRPFCDKDWYERWFLGAARTGGCTFCPGAVAVPNSCVFRVDIRETWRRFFAACASEQAEKRARSRRSAGPLQRSPSCGFGVSQAAYKGFWYVRRVFVRSSVVELT